MGEFTLAGFEVVKGKSDLLQVIGTLHTVCGFANLLDCGQKQADQNGDDSDHDQKLDKRKSLALA